MGNGLLIVFPIAYHLLPITYCLSPAFIQAQGIGVLLPAPFLPAYTTAIHLLSSIFPLRSKVNLQQSED
jgi:hypothetical protein